MFLWGTLSVVSGIRHAENMAAHTPSGHWVTTDLTETLARDKCSLFVLLPETIDKEKVAYL